MPDTPTMRRFKRLFAAHQRSETALAAGILDAIDAGDKQIDIAKHMGRSREYVRLLVEAERKRRES